MKWIIYLVALFLGQSLVSQTNPIEIIAEQNPNSLTFRAVNHLEEQQEVVFQIDTTNLKGYYGPITKIVPVKDTVNITVLTFQEGAAWRYTTHYTYLPKPNEDETKQIKESLFESIEGLNGIAIFVQDGCSRSLYATEYLSRKNVEFTTFNISNNPHNKKILNALIRIEDPELREYQMPVIVTNREVVYNIEDLEQFVKSLSSKRKR